MKQRIVILVVSVAAATLTIAWGLTRSGKSATGWGKGPLTVAEREYYIGRVSRIAKAWQDMSWRMKRGDQGRVDDPSFTCLAIDAAERRIWIESDGNPLPGYEADLPSRMDWQLFHDTPDGVAELNSLTRLRIPGLNSSQQPQEIVYLVGTRDGQETLYFTFDPSGSCGRGFCQGTMTWQSQWSSSAAKKPAEDTYPSVVATAADYERAKPQFDPNRVAISENPALQVNRLAWGRVEKALPQEIEKQLGRQGLELSSLQLTCGPDYTAASAELRARRNGWLSALRHEPSSVQAYLQIDSVGDDVWYARSAPHPLHPIPPRLAFDMEFLVSATGAIAKEDREALLAEGRRKQQPPGDTTTNWQATLPNGVVVEFIGVCENPSGGKSWWGPDGSPLGFVPYINYESYGRQREERSVYEFAWRIRSGPGGTHCSYRMEGARGSYGHQILDRYGNRIYDKLMAEGYGFEDSRERTTLRIGLSTNGGQQEWVAFKNISLVPGTNPGFEIEIVK